jgi:hypothetical protein
MSELVREASQFRKGKTPIISKYAEDHATLMATIAARGFDNLPGYSYDAENKIELAAKMSLMELNTKILAETIERELKATGLDYDLSYKNAMMAWEIEKQALMAAWDTELSVIKQGMAADEEALNLLAIEVSKRGITLLEAKTAIKLQMEAYRKTITELDSATSPYEVQLANAKLLTAQKKSGLIPIFEEIISKEQILLAKEQEKAGYYAALIAAEIQVTEKKSDLIVPMGELANVSEELAGKIGQQIVTEGLIAGEKVKQADARIDKAGYQIQEVSANISVENKKLDLSTAERGLKTTQFNYNEGIVTHENTLTDAYQNLVVATANAQLAEERALNATIISNKKTHDTAANKTKLDSADRIATAEMNAASREASYDSSAKSQIASIQAAAELTAKLTHLIG